MQTKSLPGHSSYLGRCLLKLNIVAVQLDIMSLSPTEYEYGCSYQLAFKTNCLDLNLSIVRLVSEVCENDE